MNRAITRPLAVGTITALSLYFFYPDSSRSAPTSSKTPLSPSHFTPSTVISNERSGPDTKLLQLAVPPHLLPAHDLTDPSASIWSVYIKDDDIQVERPYTPLEGIDEHGRMLFWIKKYPKGEVGRWLHLKGPNDTIELRGPLTTWSWKDDNWDEVVMVRPSATFVQKFISINASDIWRNWHYAILPTIPFYHISSDSRKQNPLYLASFLPHSCRPASSKIT